MYSPSVKIASPGGRLRCPWLTHCNVPTRPALPSNADRIKKYCNDTKDPLVPSVWGKVDDKDNHFRDRKGGCTLL